LNSQNHVVHAAARVNQRRRDNRQRPPSHFRALQKTAGPLQSVRVNTADKLADAASRVVRARQTLIESSSTTRPFVLTSRFAFSEPFRQLECALRRFVERRADHFAFTVRCMS